MHKEVRVMLEFLSEWREVESGSDIMIRFGEWSKMDFYGPICKIAVKKSEDEVTVYPASVSFEGAENSIGDFKLLTVMTKELFEEFGSFRIYIPGLKTYLEIVSEETEKPLIEALKSIPLI